MIVVDSNVIAYLYLPDQFTAQAEALVHDDPHWVAPYLWRSELRSVLATHLRRKLISFPEAMRVQSQAEERMSGNEYVTISTDVLTLVNESRCSAYDCEFIALAQRLQVKLVTNDRRVVTAFPEIAVPLVG